MGAQSLFSEMFTGSGQSLCTLSTKLTFSTSPKVGTQWLYSSIASLPSAPFTINVQEGGEKGRGDQVRKGKA